MERFRLDQRMLPTFLYRVDYPGSQTSYTRGTGFTARDTTSFYSEDSDFRKSVVEAFTWSCRNPSPYIAVFSEKSHAENWAHSWSDRNGYVCDVVTLDTRNFSNTHVFHLSALVAQLGIVLPDGAQQHQRGAYLCLHRIPAAAVCATEATSSILHSKLNDTHIAHMKPLTANAFAREKSCTVGSRVFRRSQHSETGNSLERRALRVL